ncbi:hypothetical protein [Nonomuraea sp. NPDC001831]|uniref:hypothetical protein n=1 Tax=Nonomuraea sp. NPDC001831 TaxID=3364340 RepID=UPI00367B3985
MVEIRRLGGALATAPDVPNTIDHRTAAYSLTTIAFAGTPTGPRPGRRGVHPSTWTRLTSLKTTHGPENLFL